ncbi:lysozyme [Kushneria phosphatilytica]|uniref:Lysozyme n=1 Tax=Kushneria phosphatilytica TaxID=657387 RepID=A0A1S1NR31_9GAMM|nr:lysozyme [Kushneria phosphatilytica]OHV07514.1 lysozyme [Kushneria phosphatilytica]QEL09997.1 lysozyme [Kushneria phosphatilytica]
MKIPRRLLATGSAGALSIAAAVVGYFEGTENTAYLDPVGIPTVCTGHTGAEVRAGERLSDERCDALLKEDLGEAFTALKRQVDPAVYRRMPESRRAALASFIFNVGEGNFRNSTLLRKLNAGKPRAACNELTRWVHAGGRTLPGLVRRRRTERALCLKELEP